MRAMIFLLLGLMLGTRVDGQLPLPKQIAAIEQRVGGRLGVAALDTGNGRRIEYRATERFPMCSTFKFLVAGAILDATFRR